MLDERNCTMKFAGKASDTSFRQLRSGDTQYSPVNLNKDTTPL